MGIRNIDVADALPTLIVEEKGGAKEEAQDEVEKYRQEREKQFKDFEAKHMDTGEEITAKIGSETRVKIDKVNKLVQMQ
nr:V-type proton ATPase subunit G-like [Danaus plexippus plexippus]